MKMQDKFTEGDLIQARTYADTLIVGEVHHFNQIGQAYVMPANGGQPVYVSDPTATLMAPSKLSAEEQIKRRHMGEFERQAAYVRHITGEENEQ